MKMFTVFVFERSDQISRMEPDIARGISLMSFNIEPYVMM